MKKKRRTGKFSSTQRIFIYCVLPSLPMLIFAGVLWGGSLFDYDVTMELMAPIMIGLLVVSGIIVHRLAGADKRFLCKNDFHVCRNCWHSLIGHASDETGICPECGHTFDHATDEKDWREEYGLWQRRK